MDKYVIDKITQEHNGKEYVFPLCVMAENVKTDTEHRFVTDHEKEKIKEIDTIKQSFQDGCDILVSTCTTYGATPESNSPSDISTAIGKIYNDRYDDGRIQGRMDVTSDPDRYGLYTKTQYDSNYSNGYNDGYADGRSTISLDIMNNYNGQENTADSMGRTRISNLDNYTTLKVTRYGGYGDIRYGEFSDTEIIVDLKELTIDETYTYDITGYSALQFRTDVADSYTSANYNVVIS